MAAMYVEVKWFLLEESIPIQRKEKFALPVPMNDWSRYIQCRVTITIKHIKMKRLWYKFKVLLAVAKADHSIAITLKRKDFVSIIRELHFNEKAMDYDIKLVYSAMMRYQAISILHIASKAHDEDDMVLEKAKFDAEYDEIKKIK